jgi:hypothetical protein
VFQGEGKYVDKLYHYEIEGTFEKGFLESGTCIQDIVFENEDKVNLYWLKYCDTKECSGCLINYEVV